jgi:hypothetical protein
VKKNCFVHFSTVHFLLAYDKINISGFASRYTHTEKTHTHTHTPKYNEKIKKLIDVLVKERKRKASLYEKYNIQSTIR